MDDVQAALLREIDAYLAFFKRRQEIELDYVDALRKLSARTQQGDRSFDDEAHAHIPTSWRKAWLDVRSTAEDEARSHRITAEGLERLIATLGNFRDNRLTPAAEEQDRIRRRIREDLRTTATEHSDYKNVVSRLRKTYERKVEELQNHEEAEALKEHEREKETHGARSPAYSSAKEEATTFPPEHWAANDSGPFLMTKGRNRSDSAASSKGGASSDVESSSSPPHAHSIGSPPLASVFVSGATSSSGSAPSAYRDPPTGKQNVFEAIAKRDWSGEKHRVNSIVRAVGSLAKGNDPAVALGPSRGVRSRQYGGKLKREAEQADRDYRSGIFQLETLRLQKLRVQSSARESLREFVAELASTLKTVLEQRVADQVSLGHSQVAIGEHVKPYVDRINAFQDAEDFFIGVRDEGPQEPPVYCASCLSSHVNAFVGECKSLLFGVGLQDYHANHPNLLVPLVVHRWSVPGPPNFLAYFSDRPALPFSIAKVEATGLDFEGIYRVPGKLATIQQFVHQMEKEESTFEFGQVDDVAAVAGVLKRQLQLYLRQLPIPLFPFSTADRKAFTAEYTASPDTATASLVRRIRRLSPPQQATLKALCQHLARVVDHENVNKMSASNLGLIFSTVVFGEDESATLESLANSKVCFASSPTLLRRR
ncbi:SPOSA6832_00716, partial [Sporobolomyces salmonicolor]